MIDQDISEQLQAQIENAHRHKTPLHIQAGNSKAFYGRPVEAECLDVSPHQGVIHYEPSELVITARAGSRIIDIQQQLAAQRQMLAFEPPRFSDNASLGGTLACNLSGPRRAAAGAARDHLLGCRIINGKAETLHFGGEVMKNVAGYDASRLMCGAMGTLGVLLDLSIKVLPMPETEISLVQSIDIETALARLQHWGQQPLPLSASCYTEGKLYLRLSGNGAAVQAAETVIGGDRLPQADEFWQQIREQQHPFFDTRKPLWRLSLAANQPPLKLAGEYLYEWNGALRWLKTHESADKIRHCLESLNGHATLFRHGNASIEPFHELSPGLFNLHKRLKQAFDPDNILNPGRLYPGL